MRQQDVECLIHAQNCGFVLIESWLFVRSWVMNGWLVFHHQYTRNWTLSLKELLVACVRANLSILSLTSIVVQSRLRSHCRRSA